MTSFSRRKRRTTARPTTPARTIISLVGLGWLAAGPATAADPPAPLFPLTPPAPARREPAPLVPAVKPAALPAPQSLFYQKDAVQPARLGPQAAPAPEAVLPQEPLPQPAPPATSQGPDSPIARLFRRALTFNPPNINDIGLKT